MQITDGRDAVLEEHGGRPGLGVDVRVDEPRHQRPAGGVDDAAGWRLSGDGTILRGRLDAGDEGAAHDHRRARRHAPVAVNDAGVANQEIGRGL